tara:strand:+ start:20 stop:1060 length:1041 start_codon:yes stop_codon:yes gene_type:complete
MEKYTINSNSSIKHALQKLSICGEKCLIVIDNKNKLVGTLSDGDIRKSIINHNSLKLTIKNIYNKKPKKFYENKIDKELLEKYFIEKRLEIIPIVNKNHILVDVILFSKYFNSNKIKKNKFQKNIDVIIMAGGFGKRLAPFTNIIPKPLMPYKNTTLIEYIMKRFNDYNLKNFIISVNYKEQLIKNYLEILKTKNNINFLNEKKPLGTIGSLSNLKKVTSNFFIINCDTIIDVNFHEVYNLHKKQNNDLTIVSCSKEFKIPYGCFEINRNGKMIKMLEKPKQNYLVNTGLYLMNSKVLKLITKNTKLDFNILLKNLIKKKYKIGFFTIDENSWKDFGEKSSFTIKA